MPRHHPGYHAGVAKPDSGTARGTDRGAWALAVLCCVALALIFQAPRLWGQSAGAEAYQFRPDGVVPSGDARQFAERWEAARVSLLRFHQFPSWNPWYCGGVALFGDPESPFPGPIFLLTFFWLPVGLAMNVWFLAHLALGALGAMRLARDDRANFPEQLIVAATMTGCSFFACHFLWEHLSFAPLLLLPWILFAQRRSFGDRRWIVLEAALFATAVYEGGSVAVPMMAVVAVTDALTRLSTGNRAATLRAFAAMAGLAALLAAPRLLAIRQVLHVHPPSGTIPDGMRTGDVFDAWLGDTVPAGWSHPFAWDEYSAHVGWIPLALGIVGLIAALLWRDARSRVCRSDALLLVVTVWLALGLGPFVSLWRILHVLPVFASLRVPSRFLFPAVAALALLAGHGLVFLRETAARIGKSWVWAGIEWLVLAFVVFDLATIDARLIETTNLAAAPSASAVSVGHASGFVQAAAWVNAAEAPGLGIGTTACYHPQYAAMAASDLRIGPVDQQWIVPATAGAAEGSLWSPNRLDVRVDLHEPGRLIVNQNTDDGWITSIGNVTSASGLLAVDLPAGTREVRLQHRTAGLPIALASMLLGAWWSIRLLRSTRLSDAARAGMLR